MALNTEITTRTGSKDDLVTLHIDTMGFAVKPGDRQKDNTVPGLMSRTSRNIVTITKEELVDKILHGYSIIPGVCPMNDERKNQEGGGSKQDDFVQQQIWALDFDSAIDKGSKESHMAEIIERLKELGICPFFVYSSFSDGKFLVDRNVEKFRVVFATKNVVIDVELRDKLHATLMGLFCEQIDKSCKNRNRYYNGTRPDARVYLDYEAVIDANAVVENYWDDKYIEFFPGDAKRKKKEIGSSKEMLYCDASKKRRSSSLYELMPIEEFPDVYPKVHNGLIKYDMQKHCEEFFSLIDAKDWVEGEKRRNYVFGAFNIASFTYGTREAYARCIDLNNRFKEPLSDKEFFNNIESAFEHVESNCAFIHDTQYVFRYDTLIESIEIPEEVKAGMNYYKYKREKEHADMFRPLKRERDDFICELRNEGMGAKKIRKELIKRYGEESELVLSLEGVKWFLKHRIKKGGSFGTTTFNNYCYPLNNNHLSSSSNVPVFAKEVGFDHTVDLEPLNEESYPTLNEGQERAFNDALEGYNLFVTGGAGTGKSYLVKNILTRLRLNGKSVAVCAASALAASAYEDGMTFHRLFGYKSNGIVYPQVLERLSEYDVIVIEEVGMLGKSAMDFLGLAMRSLLVQYGKTPQIILVGDVLQLPPIEKHYFFKSEWYKCFNFVPHYLIENIRQRGSEAFFRCLNEIRLGKKVWKEINSICNHGEDYNSTYLVPRNSDADIKNEECLSRLEGELIDLGNDQFVKIGAKVICKKNKYKNGEIQYYNGMQGTVVRVSAKRHVVTIQNTKGALIRIQKCDMELRNGEIKHQFPFQLGYAITIHASQGMTLESANINPHSFAPGQLYVALSRVKSAEGVHLLRNVKKKDIKKLNSEAFKFDEELRVQCGIKTVVEEMEYNNERE